MLLAPLNNLLAIGDAAKKSTKKVNSSNLVIDWTDSTKAAFQVVKDALSNATLLVHPIANVLTNIMVDASDTAGGGVLQQYQGSVWKPLAFFSKKLQVPEKKNSAFDWELLTVKHFRPFLGGRIFHILSGHKPLTYCLSANSERSSPRQIRQLAYISEFTSDIRHISGSENLPADALSRLVVDAIGNVVDLDYDKLAIAQTNVIWKIQVVYDYDNWKYPNLNFNCGVIFLQVNLDHFYHLLSGAQHMSGYMTFLIQALRPPRN